jgi:hypothetical protein
LSTITSLRRPQLTTEPLPAFTGRLVVTPSLKNTTVYYNNLLNMRFEVFMVIKIWIVVVWVVMLYTLVDGYQQFRGTYCFHLQDISRRW